MNSDVTRLKRQTSTNTELTPSKQVGHEHNPVHQRNALEFSRIMQRQGEHEQALQKDRELAGDLHHSVHAYDAEATPVAGAPVNTMPDLFSQTGRRFESFDRSSVEPSVNAAVSQAEVQGQQVAQSASSASASSGDSHHLQTGNVVEVLHQNWLKGSGSSASPQKWLIEITTAVGTTSTLEIEYTASGDWHARVMNKADEADDNHQHNESVALSADTDAQQFCIELENQLRASQPELRFSAQPKV